MEKEQVRKKGFIPMAEIIRNSEYHTSNQNRNNTDGNRNHSDDSKGN